MAEPTLVATYRREVGASLARVWENVLDWEHLPHLHRTSFREVRLLDSSSEHWRGWVTTTNAWESMIDTRLDRGNLRYLVRTVEGAGRGSEILTRLSPNGASSTGITVEFRIPDVDPALADRVGRAYVALYAQLWDEDEGMMRERQRVLDGTHGRTFRMVEVGGRLVEHATVCPHLGGPLGDAEVVDGTVTCPWHGYRFDVLTGRNVDGKACALEVRSFS
jgi:nitrite reductase/ring-hydroxylating ferredoxin subunit